MPGKTASSLSAVDSTVIISKSISNLYILLYNTTVIVIFFAATGRGGGFRSGARTVTGEPKASLRAAAKVGFCGGCKLIGALNDGEFSSPIRRRANRKSAGRHRGTSKRQDPQRRPKPFPLIGTSRREAFTGFQSAPSHTNRPAKQSDS